MSYCIYVGKNLTEAGSAFLAGYGDEPSSHWLEIVPARSHPPGATVTVGVTEHAALPGQLSEIPQAPQTARYIGVNYSYYKGVPAPITNGGLNEHGVAVRDVWSPSRRELREMTPPTQTGPNYSDLARIVLQRATSARQAVELVGSLIARHGYTTYGGNSHMFADASEGWIVIEFAGGQGLWVAERLGADDIRVSRPGYIGQIPVNYQDNPNFRGSPNFIEFAVEQGWYNPAAGEPFNVNTVYGDGQMRWPGVEWIHHQMLSRAGRGQKITLRDMMWAVRTPKLTGDTAGYGQVVQLKPPAHPEIAALWHAPASPVTAPFVPFFIGVSDVPPEYQQHRYLTAGEAALFVNPDADTPEQQSGVPQTIEATRSAFRICKRLFYLTMQHHQKFLPEVTEALEAFEAHLIDQQAAVEKTALTLVQAGQVELARTYLTYYSHTEAMNALRLADTLAGSLEARTRLLAGINKAMKAGSPEVMW